MSDSIEYDYLFLSLREMHYGINIAKIACDRSGSGNEKLDAMNRIRLRSPTPMTSHSLKSGNHGQWDAG